MHISLKELYFAQIEKLNALPFSFSPPDGRRVYLLTSLTITVLTFCIVDKLHN